MFVPDSIFNGIEDTRENTVERTKILFNWIQSQGDKVVVRYRLNWRIPHSLFNVSCNFFSHKVLQNIDWYGLHKGNYGFFQWEKDLKKTEK